MNHHSAELPTQTSRTAQFGPTQGCQNMAGSAVCVQQTGQSHELSPLHDSAPNGGGPCLSNSGFERHRMTKHLDTTQATQKD